MKDRRSKIERVVEVQRQMQRLSEWKLARLQRDEAGLRAAQEDLVNSLNDATVNHGLFIESMARRLSKLSAQQNSVQAESRTLQARMVEEAMRLKRTERLASAVARATEADAEKANLLSIVESSQAGKNDSFG